MDGHRLFVIGLRLQSEYLIIVTNHDPKNALQDYARRWEIETLFSCLKSRGFKFEETHLRECARIEKLISLLAIGFCWSHLIGEWIHEQKPIKIKTHGRKAESIFHYGFVRLRKIVLNFSSRTQEFLQVVEILKHALNRELDFCLGRVIA